jgi:hypothetical protein
MAALSKSRQLRWLNTPPTDREALPAGKETKLKNFTTKALAALSPLGIASRCIHLYFIGSSSKAIR